MNDDVELWIQPTARELAQRPESDPSGLALSPWAVDLVDGQITLGGATVDPVVARELWMRLGSLLGQAQHDIDQALWERLGRELDRDFAHAHPCHGRAIGGPGTRVDGMLVRDVDAEDRAVFRLAAFSVAILKRGKRGWEGNAYSLTPLSIGRDLRPLGWRVRVLEDAIRPLPKALSGPVAPSRRPAGPPVTPVMPPELAEKRARIFALHKAILDAIGQGNTFEALASELRIPRDALRDALESLVEDGRLAVVKTSEGPRWTPVARGREGASRAPGRNGTRLAPAPKAKKPKKPKLVAPEIVILACAPCERTVQVPAPGGRLCRFCGGPLQVVPSIALRCEPCKRWVQVPAPAGQPPPSRCRRCSRWLTRPE